MSREYGPRPAYSLASSANLHHYIDSLIQHDQLKILQSSGMQRFGRRRWSVIQSKTPQGDLIPGYCVLLVDLWIYQDDIEFHITTEAEGLHEYDISRNLLALALDTPPPNDLAAAWRIRCLQEHQLAASANRIIRQLRKLHEQHRKPIPIQVGDVQVNYFRRRYRGRLHDIYEAPGNSLQPYRLSPSQLNQEDTIELLRTFGN